MRARKLVAIIKRKAVLFDSRGALRHGTPASCPGAQDVERQGTNISLPGLFRGGSFSLMKSTWCDCRAVTREALREKISLRGSV